MGLTDIDTSDAPGQSRGSQVPVSVSLPAGPEPIREVLARLGLVVGVDLFDRALTHRSFAYERGGLPTNERLEFLGDSILGLVVTEHLFVHLPGPVRGAARQAARRRGRTPARWPTSLAGSSWGR